MAVCVQNTTHPAPMVQGRAARELAAIQGDAMTGAATDLSAVERVGIKRRVDAVSDAQFQASKRLAITMRGLFRSIRIDPANAVALATFGEAHADTQIAALDEGIRLDDIEDEHDALILVDVTASADADRRIIQRTEAVLTGRHLASEGRS